MAEQIEMDSKSLKAGLQVLVVIVRGDGKVIETIPWSTAVSRLIGSFLKRLPKKRFFQNKRDERLAEAINLAGVDEKKRYLSVGLIPSVWSQYF
jgi:hypothetical protein